MTCDCHTSVLWLCICPRLPLGPEVSHPIWTELTASQASLGPRSHLSPDSSSPTPVSWAFLVWIQGQCPPPTCSRVALTWGWVGKCLQKSGSSQPLACVETSMGPDFFCRTIRFWDLEKFQVVSCIEGEPGPVR